MNWWILLIIINNDNINKLYKRFDLRILLLGLWDPPGGGVGRWIAIKLINSFGKSSNLNAILYLHTALAAKHLREMCSKGETPRPDRFCSIIVNGFWLLLSSWSTWDPSRNSKSTIYIIVQNYFIYYIISDARHHTNE